jgi:hypothetical protein
MDLPENKSQANAPDPGKAFDEKITDLIIQRKLQQEALVKIRASVEKRKAQSFDDSHSSSEK